MICHELASELLWGMVYCRVLKCGMVFFVVAWCNSLFSYMLCYTGLSVVR